MNVRALILLILPLAFIAVTSKTPGPGHYDMKRVNSEGRTVLSTDPASRVP